MQERVWLKPLPKIEKELELLKICADVLQVCALLPSEPAIEQMKIHATNILHRYMEDLDILTKRNEKPLKVELDDN